MERRSGQTVENEQEQSRILTGERISPGIAVGPAALVREKPLSVPESRHSLLPPEEERARFNEAVARSIAQLKKLQKRIARLPEESQVEIGPLLDVYQRMLGPSRLQKGVFSRIENGLSAEAAVHETTEELAGLMLAAQAENGQSVEDMAAAERRAGEFREVARRVLRNLTRDAFLSLGHVPTGSILVADTLAPADAALIDPARVAAVVTDDGGTTGHTAIMLRALGIPTVLAVEGLFDQLEDGVTLVVDGYNGTVQIDPSPRVIRQTRRRVAAYARERLELGRLRRLASRMASGEKIALLANLELPAELPLIAQSGASGIGLLRTEFLFINAEALPDENEQYEIYATIVAAMGGESTTIRVLDWGGEKQGEALLRAGIGGRGGPTNPALGLRGIRLLLEHAGLLETQFAAILRAAAKGSVRVLLPMVTCASEIIAAREIYERVARRLKRKGIEIGDSLPPLGIMIETPAAALTAGSLAQHADFFAIGTNDLTMYTLAADRASAEVVDLYDPLHPAVIRMIGEICAAALLERCPVSICGEMAGDPRITPLLIGLGCRSFSMSAAMVPRVKQVVRNASYEACRQLARNALATATAGDVSKLLSAFEKQGA